MHHSKTMYAKPANITELNTTTVKYIYLYYIYLQLFHAKHQENAERLYNQMCISYHHILHVSAILL